MINPISTIFPFMKVIKRINTNTKKLKTSEYKRTGKFPIIDQGQKEVVGYTDDESCIVKGPFPLIAFGDHTKTVKYIENPFAIGADGVVLLSAQNVIEPRYLYFWLRQVQIQNLGYARHFSLLKKYSIQLPNYAEQQRIAGVLLEQLAAVEKARAAAQARLDAVKAMPSTFLRQVFPSPGQDLPVGWKWVRLGEVCMIKGGKRLPAGNGFADQKTDYPYIRVVDFKKGSVEHQNLKYLDASIQKQISQYIINTEDVFISIAGSIGIVGVIPEFLDGANLTENAAKLVIRNKEIINRDYIVNALNARSGIDAIRKRTNMVGQPKLALERIATIPIPLPPLGQQQRITEVLNKQLDAVDKLWAATQAELDAINTLPAALLHQAFNGEL